MPSAGRPLLTFAFLLLCPGLALASLLRLEGVLAPALLVVATSIVVGVSTFGAEEDPRTEIHVCVVTFGGEARVHTPLQPARDVGWVDMQAEGDTLMGAAMTLAAGLIVTRAGHDANLGRELVGQLFSERKALWITMGFVGLLLLSAIFPYAYFKRRGWLALWP